MGPSRRPVHAQAPTRKQYRSGKQVHTRRQVREESYSDCESVDSYESYETEAASDITLDDIKQTRKLRSHRTGRSPVLARKIRAERAYKTTDPYAPQPRVTRGPRKPTAHPRSSTARPQRCSHQHCEVDFKSRDCYKNWEHEKLSPSVHQGHYSYQNQPFNQNSKRALNPQSGPLRRKASPLHTTPLQALSHPSQRPLPENPENLPIGYFCPHCFENATNQVIGQNHAATCHPCAAQMKPVQQQSLPQHHQFTQLPPPPQPQYNQQPANHQDSIYQHPQNTQQLVESYSPPPFPRMKSPMSVTTSGIPYEVIQPTFNMASNRYYPTPLPESQGMHYSASPFGQETSVNQHQAVTEVAQPQVAPAPQPQLNYPSNPLYDGRQRSYGREIPIVQAAPLTTHEVKVPIVTSSGHNQAPVPSHINPVEIRKSTSHSYYTQPPTTIPAHEQRRVSNVSGRSISHSVVPSSAGALNQPVHPQRKQTDLDNASIQMSSVQQAREHSHVFVPDLRDRSRLSPTQKRSCC